MIIFPLAYHVTFLLFVLLVFYVQHKNRKGPYAGLWGVLAMPSLQVAWSLFRGRQEEFLHGDAPSFSNFPTFLWYQFDWNGLLGLWVLWGALLLVVVIYCLPPLVPETEEMARARRPWEFEG